MQKRKGCKVASDPVCGSIGWLWLLLLCLGCVSTAREEAGQVAAGQHLHWQDYGGGADQSKFVAQSSITKENVAALKQAFFYATADEQVYQFNPLIVDTVMYVLAKNNSLVALHAQTGEELWIHAHLQGIARRGINYWQSADGQDKRLLFQINNYLQAINAETGESILSFGEQGLVDLREGLGREANTLSRAQSGTPGKIFENLLLLGSSTGEGYMSSPGHLRAYDVVSGKLVWTFHTIPQPGEYGYETWPKEAYQYVGGVNTWGEISVDEQRGIAYYPLGSPTYDYYGADRKGSNLFANCLLALDARTGKRMWHYQTVHHDLWDYDLTAAPQLLTVTHKGEEVEVVAVASKHGFLFVFDRETGEALWPIEERAVPSSEVPGEEAWPTQPFPTIPPPISRQTITPEDLSDSDLTPEEKEAWEVFMTAEERETWRKRLDTARIGLFTPLSTTHEVVSMPGSTGGVNLGNTAANPEKGIMYVMSQSYPSIYGKLQTQQELEQIDAVAAGGGQSVYDKNCQVCHGADRSGGVGPSLLELGQRLSFSDFKQVVVAGRNKMPAFAHIEDDELRNLYLFLAGNIRRPLMAAAGELVLPDGPVVASGGAPGGLKEREVTLRGGRFGAPYPEGVEVPSDRYFIEGYGLGYPYLMKPPWSEIMAYDLNQGTVKWKRPLGKGKGGVNTGLPRGSQRNGMIVTSTGLVFSTAGDGKIYAFDADTGEELWSQELPMKSEGLPSMYAVDGKHYLVVCATTPPVYWGRETEETQTEADEKPQGGYVVFALPD